MIYMVSALIGAVAGIGLLTVSGVALVIMRIVRCLPLDRRLWWTLAAMVSISCCRQFAMAENDYVVPTAPEELAAFNAFVYGGYFGVGVAWAVGLLILPWVGRKSANESLYKFAWPAAIIVILLGAFVVYDDSETRRENLLQGRAEIAEAVKAGDIAKLREYSATGRDLSDAYEALDKRKPFQYAIEKQDLELMRYFLQLPEPQRPDLDLWMSNILATGNREAMDLLFDAGGRTPEFLGHAMNVAVIGDAREGFRYALSLGGDPNHMYSYTALMIAAQQNGIQYAIDLIDAGADVNTTHHSAWGDTNRTALSFAAEKGHVEMVRLLLENGADASIADSKEMTPIEIAKKFDQPEVVSILEIYDEK